MNAGRSFLLFGNAGERSGNGDKPLFAPCGTVTTQPLLTL